MDKIPKFRDIRVQDKTSSVYLFGNNIISLASRQQKTIDAGTAIKRLALDFVHTPFPVKMLDPLLTSFEISSLLENRDRILIRANFFKRRLQIHPASG